MSVPYNLRGLWVSELQRFQRDRRIFQRRETLDVHARILYASHEVVRRPRRVVRQVVLCPLEAFPLHGWTCSTETVRQLVVSSDIHDEHGRGRRVSVATSRRQYIELNEAHLGSVPSTLVTKRTRQCSSDRLRVLVVISTRSKVEHFFLAAVVLILTV